MVSADNQYIVEDKVVCIKRDCRAAVVLKQEAVTIVLKQEA